MILNQKKFKENTVKTKQKSWEYFSKHIEKNSQSEEKIYNDYDEKEYSHE
mgnify:CR=1 FL=1